MKRRFVAILACLALCIPMQAASYIQTKKVQYTTPYIYHNGVSKSVGSSAIIIDGTTYVPVRGIANALGYDLNWSNGYLSLNSNTYNSSFSSQVELQAKNAEIASLKKELQNLRNQLGIVTDTKGQTTSTYTQTSGNDILSSEIRDTEKDLENQYSAYFDDIEFDFDMTLYSNKLRLNITYDTSSENKAYNNLSTSKIRSFLEDVCDTVRDHHDDIIIDGRVKYDNSVKDYFTYSKQDRLSLSSSGYYDYDYDDEDDLEDFVKDILEDNSNVYIDDYSNSISIQKESVSVSDSKERVTFNIYLDISGSSSRKEEWNDNTGTDKNSALRDDLRSICKKIERETDYDIIGYIYDYSSSKEIGVYEYDDDELRTYSIS